MKRTQIVNALVEAFNQINGLPPYKSNLYNSVKGDLVFWDEVNEFPLVCMTAGSETREYQPGGFKWGFLDINIRIYVKGDDAKTQLENIFSDLEMVLDANNSLRIGETQDEVCTDIRILSISDDEGLLRPHGVGEVSLQVQYPVGMI